MHLFIKTKKGVIMTQRQRTVKIVAGPDKFALATRLFDGNNKEQLPISFTLKDDKSGGQEWDEHIKLISAEREDGSGLCWNLVGINTANMCKVTIFYTLRTRHGMMTFGVE
jgi:hypothetical protein